MRLRHESEDERYPLDITKIRRVIRAKGIPCSRNEAQQVWDMYSYSMCAGWMGLPDTDEEIWSCVSYYILDEPEED